MLVDAGVEAQNEGDYDKAIEYYSQAYKLAAHPALLFNIGQAYRLAGRSERALLFYERYLKADPNGSEADTARALLREITSTLTPPSRSTTATTRIPTPIEPGAQAAGVERPATPGPAVPLESHPPLSANSDDPARTRTVLRTTGIALTSAGGVSALLAISSGLRARALSNELSQPGVAFDERKEHDGRSSERHAIIAGVASGVLVAGGALCFWLSHRRGAAIQTTALSPLLGARIAGITLTRVLR